MSCDIPVCNDWLKICLHVTDGIIFDLISFINLIERWSKPVLVLSGDSLIILSSEESSILKN